MSASVLLKLFNELRKQMRDCVEHFMAYSQWTSIHLIIHNHICWILFIITFRLRFLALKR